MSIYEIMERCIDASLCKVNVYSSSQEKIVWSGEGDEIPEEYGEMEISSFDVPTDGAMTFNID
ncbi:MAG: hypothetical protein J6K03_09275 [Oscillospiraceae bacterium]|nr:hypothetical protein [Oscillospiraceae bacterium]